MKICSVKGSHHVSWGYWNWLLLTKRLPNQPPSANTIHSILGSLYFGDVAYSNLWRQYLIWSINLANIIVTTLHSQTKHHQTIMLGSCNISVCMASIASCTHLTNVHWLFRPWFEILGTTMAVRAEKAEERDSRRLQSADAKRSHSAQNGDSSYRTDNTYFLYF